jgi:hypothetical protein
MSDTKTRVLIIDDESCIREAMKDLLLLDLGMPEEHVSRSATAGV